MKNISSWCRQQNKASPARAKICLSKIDSGTQITLSSVSTPIGSAEIRSLEAIASQDASATTGTAKFSLVAYDSANVALATLEFSLKGTATAAGDANVALMRASIEHEESIFNRTMTLLDFSMTGWKEDREALALLRAQNSADTNKDIITTILSDVVPKLGESLIQNLPETIRAVKGVPASAAPQLKSADTKLPNTRSAAKELTDAEVRDIISAIITSEPAAAIEILMVLRSGAWFSDSGIFAAVNIILNHDTLPEAIAKAAPNRRDMITGMLLEMQEATPKSASTNAEEPSSATK